MSEEMMKARMATERRRYEEESPRKGTPRGNPGEPALKLGVRVQDQEQIILDLEARNKRYRRTIKKQQGQAVSATVVEDSESEVAGGAGDATSSGICRKKPRVSQTEWEEAQSRISELTRELEESKEKVRAQAEEIAKNRAYEESLLEDTESEEETLRALSSASPSPLAGSVHSATLAAGSEELGEPEPAVAPQQPGDGALGAPESGQFEDAGGEQVHMVAAGDESESQEGEEHFDCASSQGSLR